MKNYKKNSTNEKKRKKKSHIRKSMQDFFVILRSTS